MGVELSSSICSYYFRCAKARYCDVMVLAIVSAEISDRGNASGHLEYLSTQVSRYVMFCEGGSGPTMSMCTCLKRASGSWKVPRGLLIWRPIFAFWHGMQLRVHSRVSLLIAVQNVLMFVDWFVDYLNLWVRILCMLFGSFFFLECSNVCWLVCECDVCVCIWNLRYT